MHQHSRYEFCESFEDADGKAFLSDFEPYLYRDLPDTRLHTVQMGDTLYTIAGQYFTGWPRGCGLWWLIGQFQPTPIIDPTLLLTRGAIIHVPSDATVEYVFSEERRREF